MPLPVKATSNRKIDDEAINLLLKAIQLQDDNFVEAIFNLPMYAP
jgi:hypothetical protein